MMIKYDYQMDDLTKDERFVYDDDCGQYIFRGTYLNIVINKWNKKVNVYYVRKNTKGFITNIHVGELRLLNKIMNLCMFEEDDETDGEL